MATENISPTLYSLYDKQYDFNELRREADAGVHEYISRLRRGSKDAEQFLKAYSDIMTGIQDGSVTFKDGRFIDSRGRYTNGQYYDKDNNIQTSKKSSRDYYGLMANYVYGKLRNQNEYTPPEDKTKIKWNGTDSIKLAVTRNIMNSDTWNNDYFMDLNDYDEETGKVKGDDKRVSTFSNALTYVRNNFDNLFTGYSDTDKANAIANLDQAITDLQDNSVSNNYLSLSKAAGDLGYATIFGDKQAQARTQNNQRRLQFQNWLREKYPEYTGQLANISLSSVYKYGTNTITSLANYIKNVDNKVLLNAIASAIGLYNTDNRLNFKAQFPNMPDVDDQTFITVSLNKLKKNGELEQINDSEYIIPNTISKNNNTVYVWDSKNNKITQNSLYNIPSWRQRVYNEFLKQYAPQNGEDAYIDSRFDPLFAKKGGVIKAQTGWWVTLGKDVDKDKYEYTYDTSKLINANDYGDPWKSNIKGKKDFTYVPTDANNVNIADVENSDYYKKFTQSLLDEYGRLTDVGKKWVEAVDKLIPTGSRASFYSPEDIPRNNWKSPGGHDFNSLQRYLNYVRNDKKLGARHNVFAATGSRYYYKDANGTKHYVAVPTNLDNYNISEGVSVSEGPITWTDYEIKGPLTVTEKPAESPVNTPTDNTEDSESSYINPWQEFKRQRSDNYKEYLQRISPEALGLARLFSSLRTNHKILNTVKKSLNPVLKQTYELYSPVTGAFSEMNLANNMAAQVNRQANEAFTSDASLQAARQLDANRQANELQRKGFLSDDAEIKKTKAEALKRQEDNIARRTEVANFNRASVNNTNRELAQLKASTMKANQQSINNYLTEVEGRVRDAVEKDIERRKTFKLSASQQDIDNQYYEVLQDIQDKAEKWKKIPGNESKSLSEMPGYYGLLKELARWKNSQVLGAHANIYGYKYDDDKYIGVSPWEIASKYRLHKNGGTLRPSTLYMINKVIRNENNS